MKRKFVGLMPFVIFFCAQALSSLALDDETLSTATAKDFPPSQQVNDDGSWFCGKRQLLEAGEVVRRSGRKGKGSYGGANVVHRPNPRKSAGSPAAAGLWRWSFFFITFTTIELLHAGFNLVLPLPF
ncbi:uncharacterized protein LOC127790556 [Diospyros lotus]|uniref:uncharacterized protein LOC127790556 n=1 Tax=Diospyros lotus TaxID=55363 RepID=UPI00225492A1|nr:uncharacterized protein LOC127790556 [Diospyros lotus]